jgi:hypothetical protein
LSEDTIRGHPHLRLDEAQRDLMAEYGSPTVDGALMVALAREAGALMVALTLFQTSPPKSPERDRAGHVAFEGARRLAVVCLWAAAMFAPADWSGGQRPTPTA